MSRGWLFLPLLVVGCAKPTAENANPLATLGSKPALYSPDASAPDASGTNTPGTNAPAPPPTVRNVKKKPTPEQLDGLAKVRNAAYDYYGLALATPMRMEVDQGTGGIQTGTQTVSLVGVEGGKAFFNVVRTGGLSALGDNELRLEDSGVYVQSSSRLKVGPADLELPSDLTPGRKWSAKTETKEGEAGAISVETTSVVQGPRSVKTKRATYPDALYVTATGKGTSGGQKVSLEVKQWFVRGRGAVRSEFVSTFEGGTKSKYVIQELP